MLWSYTMENFVLIWYMNTFHEWLFHYDDLSLKRVSFGCERSCSSHRRVSNFNSKVPQWGIYPHIKFERDRLNICRVRVFTSSGSMGGRNTVGRFSRRIILQFDWNGMNVVYVSFVHIVWAKRVGGDKEVKLMMKHAPEWVRTTDPVIRSPAAEHTTSGPLHPLPVLVHEKAPDPIQRKIAKIYMKRMPGTWWSGNTCAVKKNQIQTFGHRKHGIYTMIFPYIYATPPPPPTSLWLRSAVGGGREGESCNNQVLLPGLLAILGCTRCVFELLATSLCYSLYQGRTRYQHSLNLLIHRATSNQHGLPPRYKS